MKWYEKLLMVLLVIIFSPLILVFLLVAGIVYLFHLPENKKAYKNSPYYKTFGLPFMTSRLYSPEFIFFNNSKERNLQISYIRQKSNGLEYFIHNDILFLFPDFDQIDYNEEKEEWEVDYDGNWKNFKQSYKELVSKLDENAPELPMKLLVERKMFPIANLTAVAIPDCIFLTWNYETTFENEDSPLKLIVPTNTEELYKLMVETPNLCGKFELVEKGNIYWDLFENIQIEIGIDPQDCFIAIKKLGKIEMEITHWHPTYYEIYNEICKIGIPGNVLVLRSFMGGAGVLYMGNERECPYSSDKKVLFGKFYYLRAED